MKRENTFEVEHLLMLMLLALLLLACGASESSAFTSAAEAGAIERNVDRCAPGIVAAHRQETGTDQTNRTGDENAGNGSAAAALSQPVASAIEQRLTGSPPEGTSARAWRNVRQVYEEHGYHALWTVDGSVCERTRVLVGTLEGAEAEGLRPQDYPIAAVRQAVRTLSGGARPEIAADADVVLTSAFVEFGQHMVNGRLNPRQVSPDWHIEPDEGELNRILLAVLHTRVLDADSFEEAIPYLRPQEAGYEQLRRALPNYRQLAERGGWPEVSGSGVLRVNDTSDQVITVRERLRAERLDPEPVPGARNVYDEELAGAVARFQQRHGISVDSLVGPETRRTMNIPVQRRITQIEANLERYRWLPRNLGEKYVLVNVPQFRAAAYEDGREVLSMRVVVGQEYTGTPAFSDSMSYLIFNPYWNIPQSIARDEILPQAARDPSYLARNNYQIVRQWTPDANVIPVSSLSRSQLQPGNFPYRLRQAPGSDNALGRVKFMFPNDFAIYLHDTPATHLFEERVRAYSHGCIRVERPAELAAWLLGSQGWSEQRVRSEMNNNQWRRVDLEQKVPVYIVYFTAVVQDGDVIFRQDVYGRDRAVMNALS